jgi:hypothetical protein
MKSRIGGSRLASAWRQCDKRVVSCARSVSTVEVVLEPYWCVFTTNTLELEHALSESLPQVEHPPGVQMDDA